MSLSFGGEDLRFLNESEKKEEARERRFAAGSLKSWRLSSTKAHRKTKKSKKKLFLWGGGEVLHRIPGEGLVKRKATERATMSL